MHGDDTAARFWRKVAKTDDCWIWLGARNADGYGNVRVGSRTYKAHRLAWEMAYGPIPDGLYACHRCDRPACVRPDHLFLGDQWANIGDAARKGRMASGERNGHATHPDSWPRQLTDADVAAIRAAYVPRRVSQQALAARYGVSRSMIGLLIQGKRY